MTAQQKQANDCTTRDYVFALHGIYLSVAALVRLSCPYDLYIYSMVRSIWFAQEVGTEIPGENGSLVVRLDIASRVRRVSGPTRWSGLEATVAKRWNESLKSVLEEAWLT
jgi:hypothetical protein